MAVDYIYFVHADVGAAVPICFFLPLHKSKGVEKRVNQIVNLPYKEVEVYAALLLQKLFRKCLEKNFALLISCETESCQFI